jgi:hypothetical protein
MAALSGYVCGRWPALSNSDSRAAGKLQEPIERAGRTKVRSKFPVALDSLWAAAEGAAYTTLVCLNESADSGTLALSAVLCLSMSSCRCNLKRLRSADRRAGVEVLMVVGSVRRLSWSACRRRDREATMPMSVVGRVSFAIDRVSKSRISRLLTDKRTNIKD